MGFALPVTSGAPRPSTAMPARYCLCLRDSDGRVEKFYWENDVIRARNILGHARNAAAEMGEWILIRASFEEVAL